MYCIEEIKKGKLSEFIVRLGERSKIKTVKYRLFSEVFKNKRYWILYDDKMNVVKDFFIFINFKKTKYSKNSLKVKAYELRLLYVFCECFSKNVETLEYDDYVKLGYFLLGESSNETTCKITLLTRRSRNTVLKAFSTYKDFMKHFHYESCKIEDLRMTDIVGFNSSNYRNVRKISDLKNHYTKLPKYISHEQYLQILKTIDEHYLNKEEKLRDKTIINLMFDGGCRIGEVLGLTLEDISLYCSSQGVKLGLIKIRNRSSDKLYQCAKTCMKITKTTEYKKFEYRVLNVGYQETFISLQAYKTLLDYIEISHGNKVNKSCKADNVEENTIFSNEYIFLNRFTKTSLSITLWNKTLRELFKKVGIPTDRYVKKNGLNHMFRHGFAMKLLYECKYPLEMVQKRMRHKSIVSTMLYLNPSDDYIASIKQEFEDEKLNIEKDI